VSCPEGVRLGIKVFDHRGRFLERQHVTHSYCELSAIADPSSVGLCLGKSMSDCASSVDCDQEPCIDGLGLFGHSHSWSCVLLDCWIGYSSSDYCFR